MDALRSARIARGLFSVAALTLAGTASAGIIDDASFFNPIATTKIDFETDGSGALVDLLEGQSKAMPLTEYAAKGLTFQNQVNWVYDGTSVFQAALTVGGSMNNGIPSFTVPSFTFNFTTPVKAFGFFVVNNRATDADGPEIVARNAQGNVIGTVTLAGHVDGTFSDGQTIADYGFIGLFANEEIASVTVTKNMAVLDDLRFSPVPAPGAAVLAGAGGLLLLRRRRV